jgi:hypothetical protein
MLIPIFLFASMLPPTDSPDLSWLTGQWKGSVWGGLMEEQWTEQSGGTLLGLNRVVRDGKTVHKEFMWIETGADQARLQVQLYRPEPELVSFRLTDSGPAWARFENESHRRMHAISYRLANDSLTVRLEGERPDGAFEEQIVLNNSDSAQQPPPFQGREVFQNLLTKARQEGWKNLPIGEIMGKVGWELVGTPYVGFTAERWVDEEVCSIDLTGLDCVTFYENALAFARMLKLDRSQPQQMLDQVEVTRYRGGKRTDYPSRLHYTTDWVYDNHLRNTAKDITPALPGAERFTQRVGFMTANPSFYKQLAKFPEFVPMIVEQERRINQRQTKFVPAAKVNAVEPLLKTGDILGFTTRKEGLDTSHTGMVVRTPDGKVGVLHASSTKKAVVHEPDLSEFVAGFATGIVVSRPQEP